MPFTILKYPPNTIFLILLHLETSFWKSHGQWLKVVSFHKAIKLPWEDWNSELLDGPKAFHLIHSFYQLSQVKAQMKKNEEFFDILFQSLNFFQVVLLQSTQLEKNIILSFKKMHFLLLG
jgi:hypothetical protein